MADKYKPSQQQPGDFILGYIASKRLKLIQKCNDLILEG